MSSCLGLYIQDNLIKYAKVSKEKNNLKVEAYGTKFYEELKIENAIEQIVKETFSYQVPISVNIENINYTYSNIFGLLKPQDLGKAIETEFEFFCNNNNKNRKAIEYRELKATNVEDKDKLRIIYSYIDKAKLVAKIQSFEKYKVQNISPVAAIIPNLNKVEIQENSIIVNIEKDTEMTTIINGKIYQIDKIDKGMKNILDGIALKENSVQKAYEVCKNTTVYTKSGQNLKLDGNEYLDEIITNLFEIIDEVKQKITSNGYNIDNIYITGMGLIINNVDLLFQESFIDKKCEILIPYFIEKTNVKINTKDYIEVNSAISLALKGLDTKKDEMNFCEKNKSLQKIWTALTSDVGKGNIQKVRSEKPHHTFKEAMQAELDITEKVLFRITTALCITIILYIGTTDYLSNKIEEKSNQAQEIIADEEEKIQTINEYDELVEDRTEDYQEKIEKIQTENEKISENYSRKCAIPNLLNKIMYNIPTGVQLTRIENTSGKNITISAQAEKYDQLGYFKTVLEEEGILTNVTTDKGQKTDDMITITITGSLPY